MKLFENLFLAFGVALGGWFIGNGIITFRAMDQVVEVRGLDERMVWANEGSLDLRYVVSAPTIKELSVQLDATQKAMEEFLGSEGFSGPSVQKVAVTISDNVVNRSSNEVFSSGRFSARAGAQVFSTDVPKIQALSQKTAQLISKGVALESTFPRSRRPKAPERQRRVSRVTQARTLRGSDRRLRGSFLLQPQEWTTTTRAPFRSVCELLLV